MCRHGRFRLFLRYQEVIWEVKLINTKITTKSFSHLNKRSIFAALEKTDNKVIFKELEMTKADIVAQVSEKTGIEKAQVLATVESYMEAVKDALAEGENVYFRGFGSFIVKKRAEKTGRNISKNTTIIIPAHNIPAFKPAKTFVSKVKDNVNV